MNALAHIEELSDGRQTQVAMSKPDTETEVTYERDRRGMNHMSPEIRMVHLRLEEWGRRYVSTPLRDLPFYEASDNVAKTVLKQSENDRALLYRFYVRPAPDEGMWRDLPHVSSKRDFDRKLRLARERVAAALKMLE